MTELIDRHPNPVEQMMKEGMVFRTAEKDATKRSENDIDTFRIARLSFTNDEKLRKGSTTSSHPFVGFQG